MISPNELRNNFDLEAALKDYLNTVETMLRMASVKATKENFVPDSNIKQAFIAYMTEQGFTVDAPEDSTLVTVSWE